jgi:hypothetical protein
MLGEGLECPHNPEAVGSNPAPATNKFTQVRSNFPTCVFVYSDPRKNAVEPNWSRMGLKKMPKFAI